MDPVTYSIIRHRLFRITDEAVITLKHVSGSAITNEGHDLLVWPLPGRWKPADGWLRLFVSHGLTSAAERPAKRSYGGSKVTSGKTTFLPQRSVHGGAAHFGHLSRFSDPLRRPARRLERLLRARGRHRRNKSRRLSPDAQDIFTEGFCSPGIKLVARGELRQDVFDTILNMVRTPEMVALDIRSMIACHNVTKERMHDLIEKYGRETVDTSRRHANRAIRTAVASGSPPIADLPKGKMAITPVHECRRQDLQGLPHDGENDGKCLTFDFTGESAHRTDRPINCTRLANFGARPAGAALTADLLRRVWNEGDPADHGDRAGKSIANCTRLCTDLGRDRRRDPSQHCRKLGDRQDARGQR